MKTRVTYKGLSARASNCLWHLKVKPSQVRDAIRRKIVHPSNVNASHLGWKTYHEIRAWCGLRPELQIWQVFHIRCELARQLHGAGHTMEEIARILRLGTKNDARRHVMKGEKRNQKMLETIRVAQGEESTVAGVVDIMKVIAENHVPTGFTRRKP